MSVFEQMFPRSITIKEDKPDAIPLVKFSDQPTKFSLSPRTLEIFEAGFKGKSTFGDSLSKAMQRRDDGPTPQFKPGDRVRIKADCPEKDRTYTGPGFILQPGHEAIVKKMGELRPNNVILEHAGCEYGLAIQAEYVELVSTAKPLPHPCHCPMSQLMSQGCTCGGV